METKAPRKKPFIPEASKRKTCGWLLSLRTIIIMHFGDLGCNEMKEMKEMLPLFKFKTGLGMKK